MKNDPSGNYVHEQHPQHGSAVPPVDKLLVAPKDDADGNRQQKNGISRLEKGVERATRLMEFLTALMVIITFGGVVVAIFQWKTAQVQFRDDQRPYVMSHADENFTYNEQHLLLMKFRNGNYGKSPAIEAGGMGKVFLGADAMQQAERWVRDELPAAITRRNRSILPPNIPASHVEARDTAVRSDRPVSAEELNVLLQNSFAIVAVMRQAYRDTAGNEYWTDSCVGNLVTGPGRMRIVECTTINYVK